MKTLLLLRHAKSDWEASFATDEQRPLAERGRRAASHVGAYCAALDLEPDEILSSPAVRAQDTALRVAAAAGWRRPITTHPGLYGASVDSMLHICRERPSATSSLLLVGHQPVWSSLASTLLGGATVQFPTAALLRLDAPIEEWEELGPGRAILRWMVIPRQLAKLLST